MHRQPHAALDIAGRQPKAQKIHALLSAARDLKAADSLLEIGTGSGAIAAYFAQFTPLAVTAVDTQDQRQVAEGYAFQRVVDTTLPFADASFDFVISNHVIEHVGDANAQRHHLREIARVLAPHGVAYLAVPSRWQIREPHYGTMWLSWLPPRWRTPYLRWRGLGEIYDCRPLTRGELECLIADAGLLARNQLRKAVALYAREKSRHFVPGFVSRLPASWLEALAGASPTHIYLLTKDGRFDR